MKKILAYPLFLFVSFQIYAASQQQPLGLGKVAQNMLTPVSVFSDFVNSACFIIGASFLFASLIKYIEHRRSPLMVPISTVVFLLIAGIFLILLPFLSYFTDPGVQSYILN